MKNKEISQLIEEAMNAYWNLEDYSTAFEKFKAINDADATRCNLMLGICYEFGDGVQRDIEKAKNHYRCGILSQGGDDAQKIKEHSVSLFGDGVNRRHGNNWLFKAEAEKLEDEGDALIFDDFTTFDFDKGTEMLKKAAERGSALACDLLSSAHYLVETRYPNYSEAKYWAALGIQGGLAKCGYYLGCIYLHGDGINQPDLHEAFYWYRKSALMGCVESMQMLCVLYFDAVQIPDNYAKAEFWGQRVAQIIAQTTNSAPDTTGKNAKRFAEINSHLSEEGLQRRQEIFNILQNKVDEFERIELIAQQQGEAADAEEIQRFEADKTAPYNALLICADGLVKKIKLNVVDCDARKRAVDAQNIKEIETLKLTLFGNRVINLDLRGFFDSDGDDANKCENNLAEWLVGRDGIMGDVVLCAYRNGDCIPLSPTEVDEIYKRLNDD